MTGSVLETVRKLVLRILTNSMIMTALLLSISAPLALNAQDTEPVCDGKGRVANLDFTVKDVNGKDVALNAHKGKVVLLDFWATWCPPCRKEIPGFVEL